MNSSPYLSCTGEPRNWHSTADGVSPRLGRGKTSPPSTCLWHSSQCRPQCPSENCWLTSTLVLTRPSRSFSSELLKYISSTYTHGYYTDTWGYYFQGAKLHILWLNFMKLFPSHFPSLLGSIWMGNNYLMYRPLLPVLYHQEICWACTLPLYPGLMETLRNSAPWLYFMPLITTLWTS